MPSIRSSCRGFWVVAAIMLLLSRPAPANAQDLFTQHEVTVQFASPEGKPLANAEVRVFAPGERPRPDLTGHTDSHGKFEFPADTDGFWTAEAHVGSEIARVMIRVGAAGQGGGQRQQEPLSPYWVLGGLFVLLILAFVFRIARARLRARIAGRGVNPGQRRG